VAAVFVLFMRGMEARMIAHFMPPPCRVMNGRPRA
jgi:hypothetical protein